MIQDQNLNGQYRIHRNLAVAEFRSGHYNEAIVSYNRAIELNPNYAAAHASLGDCHYRLGNYHEAIVSSNRAIVLDPNDALAYIIFGEYQFKLGDRNVAIDLYNKALGVLKVPNGQNHKKSAEKLIKAYQTYLNVDAEDKSAEDKRVKDIEAYKSLIEACEILLSIDPKNVDALNEMGNSYNMLGKLLFEASNYNSKAIECYNKVLEMDPKNEVALLHKIISLRDIGEESEAKACEELLQLNDEIGDIVVAPECYNTANTVYPSGEASSSPDDMS